jgi:hypothetical protein
MVPREAISLGLEYLDIISHHALLLMLSLLITHLILEFLKHTILPPRLSYL